MTDEVRLPLDELGRVLGEPARLRILHELFGGTPLPAGALATRLGLAPSTVSAHLAKLHDAGLITIEQRGRARLASLTDPAVATAVEALLQLSGEAKVNSATTFDRREAMREARSCYDHLAGRAGVFIAELAMERGWIADSAGAWTLPAGEDITGIGEELGLTLEWQRSSRPAVRPCADWTERAPHIAGRLGHSILAAMIDDGWLRRRRDDRALTITARGRERLVALGHTGL
ncbi:metalloregulator ArsR/SmtB family transcription factor [Microbacterium sp. KUDC0406]|uniref:ArsR/SmtB family transcription factor n=1 Tax=Microbacterium sp. KUDC0406 TaxID=2909588 RepID=UPI001F3FB24C|nr:metalloregulator ArsR/SmtB family transcription factor [Microbacterium sp. KUDC0406]UJP10139.1 metalloregulator ArsR/SmtB family transcription factor [Microbacterium sp. KUDC0406]